MPIPIVARILGGTGFLATTGAFGYFGASMLRKSYKLASKGIATTGTVIGFDEQMRGGVSRWSYSPKVEFQIPSGEKITFVASVGSNVPPKLGRTVKVLYLSDNPQEADLNSLLRSWLFPMVALLTGCFFLFGSLMFYTNIFGQAR